MHGGNGLGEMFARRQTLRSLLHSQASQRLGVRPNALDRAMAAPAYLHAARRLRRHAEALAKVGGWGVRLTILPERSEGIQKHYEITGI